MQLSWSQDPDSECFHVCSASKNACFSSQQLKAFGVDASQSAPSFCWTLHYQMLKALALMAEVSTSADMY